MHLSRFKVFTETVRKNESLTSMPQFESVSFARRHEGQWFDERDEVIVDNALISSLEKTLKRRDAWRERLSRETFVPISRFEAVAHVTTSIPIYKPTRDQMQSRIDSCVETADNEFDATHDPMTGLLNKQAFESRGCKILDSASTTNPVDAEALGGENAGSGGSIIAIDIDNFKQVNDTFGHLYGDIVIGCLASRLDDCVKSIHEGLTSLETLTARPSGEEFLVLVAGDLSPTKAMEIAEKLRRSVSDKPLPSEEEWEEDRYKTTTQTIELPSDDRRRTTVSVGVSHTAAQSGLESSELISLLRQQADIALYSAKSGGRNRSRYFGDIQKRFGTIIEHHPDTDIVAIDIGAQVGVKEGQEFHVYHPDFAGDRPFRVSDGRTERTLGQYPRIRSGRIVAFDTQQDVSFCRVEERLSGAHFPRASRLEAIPTGSISHLIKTVKSESDFEAPGLIPESALRDVQENEGMSFVVCGLLDEKSLLDVRGSVFVNRALARLYDALKGAFSPDALIAQSQRSEFCIAVREEETTQTEQNAIKALDEAAKTCNSLASFCAGGFSLKLAEESRADGDESEFRRENSIDYARYAMTLNRSRKRAQFGWFDSRVALGLMLFSREQHLHPQAVADYHAFKDLGIRNARLENLAALSSLAGTMNDRKLATAAIEEAVRLDPANPVFSFNAAAIWQLGGFTDKAFEFLEHARTCADTEPPGYTAVAAALIELEVFESDPDRVPQERVIASIRHALEQTTHEPYLRRLRTALEIMGVDAEE